MTVARMLEQDTFEIRYKKGDPIGVHEFHISIRSCRARLRDGPQRRQRELGGTDQTNNLVGRDLQR